MKKKIQILSLDHHGRYDMGKYHSPKSAIQIVKAGFYVEVYLGQEPDGPPAIGLIFKDGKYSHYGLGCDKTDTVVDFLPTLFEGMGLDGIEVMCDLVA